MQLVGLDRLARPKGPAYTYVVLSAVVLILVGAIALNASQASPPAIAEFAPQALEQIKDAPAEQTTNSGSGSGAGQQTNSDDDLIESSLQPSPRPTPTNVPRTRRCYGPPNDRRQTEDPQSPPCVDYVQPDADNGGATSFGVTAKEIIVAWPYTIEKTRDTETLASYFNSRYEFYGRKMVLKLYDPTGGVFGAISAADMQKDAEKVKSEKGAFASLAYVPRGGAEYHYYDALAQKKVISVDSHASNRTESHLARWSPYEWSYLPAFDVMMRNYGEWLCKTLADRPPRYAGEVISRQPGPRVFGLTYTRTADGSAPDVEILKAALKYGCGVEPATTVEYSNPSQVVGRFVDRRVTTAMCLCGAGYFKNLMTEATNQVFFPEWIASTYHYQDYDSAAQTYPAEHAEHVLGITFHNKWVHQKDMPWYQAIKEADPYYETGDDGWASSAYERYYELLTLASGIQMAGPNLTPETFRQGIYKARFPPPGSGDSPLYYPGGGFGPGDHSMVDDAAMIWYSASDEGYTTNVRRGTFCYIRHGKRYGLGQWLQEDPPFFTESCK